MISKSLRKIVAVISGAVAVIGYITACVTLSGLSSDDLIAIYAGRRSPSAIWTGIGILILSAVLILLGRSLFGGDGHGKSRSALAITLATIPVQKLLLFGLKYYILCASDLTKKIAEMFVHNTGILEVVLALLSLGIGLFVAVTKRAVEYGEKPLSEAENNVKAGLLGMLGVAGYDIVDVILTSYDDQKTAILIFESDDAWKKAIEKGYDQEILAACRSAEPDYDYRFEARG